MDDKIIGYFSVAFIVLTAANFILVAMHYYGTKELRDVFEFKRPGITEEERQLKSAEYLKIQFPDWTAKRIAGALGISESTLRRTGFKMRHERKLSDDERKLSDDERKLSDDERKLSSK